MKKKIAILGSTGSIGKSTIDIIKKDKKNFDVILLTANNNFREINKIVINNLFVGHFSIQFMDSSLNIFYTVKPQNRLIF